MSKTHRKDTKMPRTYLNEGQLEYFKTQFLKVSMLGPRCPCCKRLTIDDSYHDQTWHFECGAVIHYDEASDWYLWKKRCP